MKLSIISTTVAAILGSTQAFSTSLPKACTTPATTQLFMSSSETNRRQVISKLISGITLTVAATPAFARREPLPEYLTEPTDEFKESERQRDEFRRKQLAIKRKFNTVLDRLTFESKTEEELVNDLKELRYLVIETEGLPLGIKKEEMIKIIRAKKAKGFWPTNVEIAYQKLTSEIAYQQSPNREKDIANPL